MFIGLSAGLLHGRMTASSATTLGFKSFPRLSIRHFAASGGSLSLTAQPAQLHPLCPEANRCCFHPNLHSLGMRIQTLLLTCALLLLL